jgi:hypothetical protein
MIVGTLSGFPSQESSSRVSDESIPERGGRKNVSELACSYHVATTCDRLVYEFLIEGGHEVGHRSDLPSVPGSRGISSSSQASQERT